VNRSSQRHDDRPPGKLYAGETFGYSESKYVFHAPDVEAGKESRAFKRAHGGESELNEAFRRVQIRDEDGGYDNAVKGDEQSSNEGEALTRFCEA
jgi:hypothetical protein